MVYSGTSLVRTRLIRIPGQWKPVFSNSGYYLPIVFSNYHFFLTIFYLKRNGLKNRFQRIRRTTLDPPCVPINEVLLLY